MAYGQYAGSFRTSNNTGVSMPPRSQGMPSPTQPQQPRVPQPMPGRPNITPGWRMNPNQYGPRPTGEQTFAPGGQRPQNPFQGQQQGGYGQTRTSTPYGTGGQSPAQNPAGSPMMPSTGAGTRRYYDQLRNNMLGQYDQRSGQLQGQYDKRITDLTKQLEGYGNQQLADARQSGRNMQSDVLGNMAARGLSGTTVLPSMQMAANTNSQNNINRINEQLQNQKVGLATQLTGDALGYGERALGGYTALGQQNMRDSRGDYENDRNFGESQYQGDRDFAFNQFRDDRNFQRGAYENDRDFGNRNFENDRYFDYNRGQDDRNWDWRNQQFQYQQQQDAMNRNDRLALEQMGFMERRTDEYPDIDQMMQMLEQFGLYG